MNCFRTAVLTGATGFIGSALARRLVDEGIKVYGIVRTNSSCNSLLEIMPGVEKIQVQSFKTEELKSIFSGIPVDIVFNLASYGVNQQHRDPKIMLEGNVDLVANLLLSLRDSVIKKFIHVGSCSEYGNLLKKDVLFEGDPIKPVSLYGAAKAASSIYGNALAINLGIPFVTLRLFGVYGVGENHFRLIPYLIHKLSQTKPVDLTPGDQVRDFLYIDDVIDALIAAAQSEKLALYSIFNVCSGHPTRIRDVAEAVADTIGRSRNLLLFGKRPHRQDEPMVVVGDNSRFIEATNWRPRITLAEGISKMVNASKVCIL